MTSVLVYILNVSISDLLYLTIHLKSSIAFLIRIFEIPEWLFILLFMLLVTIIVFLVVNHIKYRKSVDAEINELKKNEERLRNLTSLTFEGIIIHRQGIFIDCNDSFLKIVGYEKYELMNQNIVEKCIHVDDIKIVAEKVKTKDSKPYEVRGVRKNGQVFPVEIESRNVLIDGKSVRVAAIRDLTEIKRQKELIEREQWLLSTLMRNIPDSIYFKDLESKFIRVNKSTCEKFNVKSAEELIGKNDFDIFDEEHALPAFNDEQQIIKTKIPIVNKVEKEAWKDGKVTWVSTSKLPLIDSSGNVVGTFGLTRDITELKNAQDNLIAEKEKFERLLRLVPSAVFTVDMDRNITSWNFMAEKLTGFAAQETIGHKCSDLAISPCADHCSLFDNNIPKPAINVECKLRRKDEKIITISKNVDYVKDTAGEIIGGIESFIDISERKEYEEKIREINLQLEESNKSKDKFFSIIAHDLRNPFVTLLGFTEMMIEDYFDFTDEEKISYLKDMQKTSKASHELLDNLLQWSRSQTGRIDFEPKQVNLIDVVLENYQLVKKSADLKNIKLHVLVDDNVILYADENMITTILRNLLTNAIKFTPQNGSITIASNDLNKDTVQVSIIDTGIGIEPERIDKIFRIAETSSTEGTEGEKGSGLGLILSKEFVEKHGGKIWVESSPGAGTTFYFTLPKANN